MSYNNSSLLTIAIILKVYKTKTHKIRRKLFPLIKGKKYITDSNNKNKDKSYI